MANLTETEIDRLCRQSILTYCDIKGIPYNYDGNGYYRLKDHDSLIIDTKTKPYDIFFWNSRGHGGNLFHFLKYYEGMSGRDAIEFLKRNEFNLSKKAKTHHFTEPKRKIYQPEKWRGTKYPHAVKDYLVNTRKLNPNLVDGLLKSGLVRELYNGDALFVWYDHQMKEVGADVQGTRINHQKFGKRGTRKHVAGGSKSRFGFHFSVNNGKAPTRLYIFESPIDALSFAQMHGKEYPGQQRFLSLNGSASKSKTITNFIGEMGRQNIPSEIHMCLDTDEAGYHGVLEAKEQYDYLQLLNIPKLDKMKFVVDQPPMKYKDWNEQLQKGKDQELSTISFNQFKEIGQQRFPEKQPKHPKVTKQRQYPVYQTPQFGLAKAKSR